MARIAGRNGVLYMGLTSAGVPTPVAYLANWSLAFSTTKIDVTAFGDTTKIYVSGLPDCTGTYAGFYDDATVQMYTAATDGVPRKFYLYPSTLTAGQYWYGTGIFDMSIDAAVDGPVAISGGFAAASVATKIG
jgi:hypothetical protein